MAAQYWLIKSEPSVYAFETLVREKKTRWDGIRSFEARNNLRAMKKDDVCLFYHSNDGKEVVGLAKIIREAYADPSSDEDWSVVDIAPIKALTESVTLRNMKAHAKLSEMAVVKKSRLSVSPVTADQFKTVLAISKTKL